MQSLFFGSLPSFKHSTGHSHSSHSHHSHSKDKGNKRKATRVQRACGNCRKRKQGCEEERPCRRCVEKGIDCTEVEPKRKRGRSKSFGDGMGRERSSRSGEYSDSNEEDMEDSFESDEEGGAVSSDEEELVARNTRSSGMSSHTFQLEGSNASNTSIGSNLHNSPFVTNHSISLSNSNSTVQSLSASGSDIVTSRFRTATPPDSPGAAEPNDEAENDGDQFPDMMHDDMPPIDVETGLNLSLMLPFIANLCPVEETLSPMTEDDEYGFPEHEMDSSSVHTGQAAAQLANNAVPETVAPSESWSSELPFFSSASGLPKTTMIEEGDVRAQVYIKECWNEFQNRSKFSNMESDLQRAKELWKEILRCLRCLDWPRAQTLLQEAESSPTQQYFGEQAKPSILFWSSGGRIHHANESFCKLVGYTAEELRASVSMDMTMSPSPSVPRLRAHSFFHPEEMMKIMKRQLEAVQHPEKSSYQMNSRLLSKFRQEIPVSCSILNVRDNFGMQLLTVAIFM